MTTTPIKRNKNLVPLSHDHHDGLMIVWKIRQGLRFNVSHMRITNFALNAFAIHLHPHFIEEEEVLFTKLSSDDALRIKAEGEHAAIRNMIAALQPAEQSNIERLQAFAKLLEDHIRFEERILFPHIEGQLNDDELTAIGESLQNRHSDKCTLDWHDEFWIHKKA